MTLLVFFATLFGFIAIGVPIAFALVLCGMALMVFMGPFESHIIAQRFIDGLNSYSLLAVPFFVLAGELMSRAGITKRIIDFAMVLIGHVRAGLGYVVVMTSVIFAGLSGSAIADTAAVGTALVPVMRSYGYNISRVTGLIVSSGIIGPIIPPSVGLIIYGVVTETSIIRLFMAGIIPGLLFGLGLMIVWNITSRKDTNMVQTERHSFNDFIKVTKTAFWALILPIVIIGGLRVGIFTATEAGVVAVFYALFVGLVIYREIKLSDLPEIFIETAKTTGTVLLLVGAGSVTAWYITLSDIPQQLTGLLGGLIDSPTLLMLLIVGILFLVGMVMDITPSTLILAPIFLVITNQAGIDPIYFGIIFMVTLTIGLITPPIGVVLFTGMKISGISLVDALKGVWPFILVELIIVILMVLFPQIILVPLKFLI
ncbi:MAG: TRAP transporter large permease [Bacillota bacterium]